MALYPQDFIEKVLSSSNILDIVSQYTDLKQRGRDFVGRCPFPDHKERTASFHVTPEKQVFHCFGCKKGGGVVKFLELYNGFSFRDSVEYLANRYNIPIPELTNDSNGHERKTMDEKKAIFEINKLAAFYFHENLKKQPKDSFVWKYIQSRGLKAESLELFQIGYSGEEWDGLAQFLEKKGKSLVLAEKAGLVKARTQGKSGYFDLFRQRLMFTIQSASSDVIGFGGRILGEGQPKYLNSPETPVFHKGRALYGLNHSARYIRSEDQAIVVEGYMDLIGLYQAGVQNVVAPLGTALTTDHARILERITQNVVILFDGDAAGQNASERSLPILLESGSYPKGLVLPDGLDPDEYILKFGVDKLKELIANSEELFSMILNKYLEGYKGDSSDKMKLVGKLRPIIQSTRENALKSLYLREVAKKINVDLRWLNEALEGNVKSTYVKPPNAPVASPIIMKNPSVPVAENPEAQIMPSLKGASKVELLLLAFLFSGKKEIWDQVLHTDLRSMITHTGVTQVLEKAWELSGQGSLNSASLISLLANQIEGIHLLTAAISEVPKDDEGGEGKLFADCLRKLRLNHLELQLKQLANIIRNNPSSENLERLRDLQRERLQFVKESAEKK